MSKNNKSQEKGIRQYRETKPSIRIRMAAIFLICWFLPMALMLGVSGYYIFSRHFDETAQNIRKELEFNSQICVERLNQAIRLSRTATLDRVIEEAYTDWRKGRSNYHSFYLKCAGYLSNEYRQREDLEEVVFWCYEDSRERNASIYNTSSGGSYQNLQDYWREDHDKIYEFASELDTTVGFLCLDGRLYLVRNMMSSSYVPMGALVMRLNVDYCLGSLKQFPLNESAQIWLDGQELLLNGSRLYPRIPEDGSALEQAVLSQEDLKKFKPEKGYIRAQNEIIVGNMDKQEDYSFSYLVRINNSLAQTPLYGYRYVFVGMVLFLFPLLFLLRKTFLNQIAKPLKALSGGARQIQEGKMGYQIGFEPENREFLYLRNVFNEMSTQIKYQFDHIYEEELALRDARIMALQSNINPHFMNNTLEIINWAARMGDNARVSNMIGALSTLMDAAMDRKRKAEVPLSEEMMYVDAYLYIISERFGKRLTVEKEIAPDTLHLCVPRLILQPVIENAIEHGVQVRSRGTVTIRSRARDEYLYLDIINDGELTEEAEAKIGQLLAPDYDTSHESSGNLGIANVNQRLRILYGDGCGLSIKRLEDRVLARLTIIQKEQ